MTEASDYEAFVSYSRPDRETVLRLEAALRDRGRRIWVDWEGIPPTAEWMAEIREAIDAADAVLFVLSPTSAVSRVCAQEVEHAVARNKRIIPVLAHDVDATQVPHELSKRNWVLLRESDDFARGIDDIVAVLDTDLELVKRHTRLSVRAAEWEASGRSAAKLLRGGDLSEAESWLAAPGKGPEPTAEQTALVTVSRQAASRVQRRLITAVSLTLVGALVLGVFSFVQREKANREAVLADGRGLAAQATALSDKRLDTALLLAAEGYRRSPGDDTESGLLSALNTAAHLTRFLPQLGRGIIDHSLTADRTTAVRLTKDGAVQLFATSTWRETGPPLVKGLAGPYAVCISPRGDVVAVSAADGTHVYDTAGNDLSGPFGTPQSLLAFSHDGRRIYTRGFGPIESFDTRTGRKVRTFTAADSTLLDADNSQGLQAQLTPEGRSLVLTTGTRLLVLDAATGRQQVNVPLPRDVPSTDVEAVSGTGLVAAVGPDNTIYQVSLKNGTLQGPPLRATGSRVATVAFAADGSHIVASADDGGIRVWDTATGTLVATMLGHSNISGATCLNRACTKLLGASSDEAAVWDVKQQLTLGATSADQAAVVLPLPDGGLATAGLDGFLRFYRANLGQAAAPMKIPVYDLHGGGDIDAAGKTIVIAGTGNALDSSAPPAATAVAIDVASRSVTRTFRLPGAPFATSAAISPRGDNVVVGGHGQAAVFNLTTGAPVGATVTVDSRSTSALAWSADGSRFFTGGQDGILKAWHVDRTVKPAGVVTISTGALISDVRLLDGVLAVASEDGILRLVEPATLRIRTPEYVAGGTQLQTAALDPGGDRVYSTSRDGRLRIWSRTSGRSIGPPLAGHDGQATALIATGRRTLYSAGLGAQASLIYWDLTPQSWLAKACALAGRNLTRVEWDTYLPGKRYRKTCARYPSAG